MDVTATRPAQALDAFHPAVAAWFRRTFAAPTGAQALAWPHIKAGRSTLVAAPTGSGKTLTAFLCALDDLVRDALAHDGALPDATLVVYVSPLKALSNDIHVNLDAPLAGIAESLARLGLPVPAIRTAVRTGDTTQSERAALRKRAPHILVTTPESLYVLLSSTSGRQMLSSVRSVIVDEIHALASSKRGSHLALSLERLDALTGRALPRIGLSATQKPIEAVARFLVGGPADAPRDCTIVDTGHTRERDLALELPNVPLEPVMATDVWDQVYDRIAALAAAHRTTLVFVNTRRTAERMARHLAERLGKDAIAAHHGSLAKEHRFEAEQRLKRGELKLLVATASLELGIDIGDVDLVCQVGSPRGIAPFLQRVGRSGHHVGGVPKGRLFPLSRDELVECAALLDCVRRGELDTLRIPEAPLDVLAQQIVAEVACTPWQEDALYAAFTRAAPYARLSRERFDDVLKMLAEGFTSRRGVRGAYLHRDVVGGTVRGRRNAMMTATTSGGTIPDMADYAVLLEPQGIQVGTVNEDFAVESLAGDVFQLGNQSYRIIRVETGRVRVEDARGQPPSIPFWLGEAPGRSDELSAAVGRLRARLDGLLAEGDRLVQAGEREPARIDRPRGASTGVGANGAAAKSKSKSKPIEASRSNATDTALASEESRLAPALRWLVDELRLSPEAARQIVDYLARTRAALGALPTQHTLVMERFFDESGGTQLVIHSPFGSRINRAWGLALRKRFCRSFNFELQAAATDDAIVLSLSLAHSFALDEVWRYLRSASAEHVLVQALLDAPLFGVRWRWNATTSLALPRFTGGRRTAPQLQRMKSDDLLATVFPDQAACLENVVGEREIPHHPLVDQTLDDCLHDAMDTDGWLALLRRIESGEIELIARDLPAPSPLAAEILNAKPYAFLDDAPLEERRTQAVQSRRWSDPESADDLGALDADAIAAVRDEAWPLARDAHEMHDALLTLACVADSEANAHDGWPAWLAALAEHRRATRCVTPDGQVLWVPVERLVCMRALHPDARFSPALKVPAACAQPWEADAALVDVIRARLTGFGPLTVGAIAEPLGLPPRVGRDGARRAGARGLRDARPLHARRDERRMVRTPPARPDSSLYGQALAPRDRAGRARGFHAVPVALAAPDARHARHGPRRARGRRRATRRLRGGGRRLGRRAAACAPDRLHGRRPRRAVPLGQARVDAHRRTGTRGRHAGEDHARRAAAAPPPARMAGAARPRRATGVVRARDAGARRARHPWRNVLRRAARRVAHAPRRARAGARRAGVCRPRECGQLRRAARAAEAGGQAQRDVCAAHAARRRIDRRDGRCGPLGARAARRGAGRCAGARAEARRNGDRSRCARAHRVDAAAPLWRGVLAAARARGRMAAELAGARARAATARGARRDSRRPLRRRHRGRAVRAAGSDPGPA